MHDPSPHSWRDLLRIGRLRGWVTYEEVSEVLHEDATPSEVDAILEELVDAGIEIVEDAGEAEEWQVEGDAPIPRPPGPLGVDP